MSNDHETHRRNFLLGGTALPVLATAGLDANRRRTLTTGLHGELRRLPATPGGSRVLDWPGDEKGQPVTAARR